MGMDKPIKKPLAAYLPNGFEKGKPKITKQNHLPDRFRLGLSALVKGRIRQFSPAL